MRSRLRGTTSAAATSTSRTTSIRPLTSRHVGAGVCHLPRSLRPTVTTTRCCRRYINAIGQRLVPKDSPNIYSFKLLLDPIPKAEALSTGTILVSTGMVSMLDNEAQLAYVLGHEIAHVEKNHAYTIVRMSVLEPALNEEKEKETKEKRAIGRSGHDLCPPRVLAASTAD